MDCGDGRIAWPIDALFFDLPGLRIVPPVNSVSRPTSERHTAHTRTRQTLQTINVSHRYG
jgi:hypothetical protein